MNETHTEELRAKILGDSGFWPRTVRELCDALDQAWAQWRHNKDRAEAAEAALEGCQRAHDITDAKRVQAEVDRDRWNLVADLVGVECLAAKARIAAALALKPDFLKVGKSAVYLDTVRRTLTEGTGQ